VSCVTLGLGMGLGLEVGVCGQAHRKDTMCEKDWRICTGARGRGYECSEASSRRVCSKAQSSSDGVYGGTRLARLNNED